MKNRNDSGSVHFDASTNEAYRLRVIDFRCMGQRFRMALQIPQTILDSLTSADFDEMKARARQLLPDKAAKMLASQAVALAPMSIEQMSVELEVWLKRQICEELYNRFHIRQSKRGDMVWATPELMQDVGPSPEEDDKYLVNGVLQ